MNENVTKSHPLQTKFKLKDVQVPENPGMFATFMVNGKTPLFVDAAQFSDPEHYVKMMGYDKPLDLKLHLEEAERPAEQSKSTAKKPGV